MATEAQATLARTVGTCSAYKRSIKTDPDHPQIIARNVVRTHDTNVALITGADAVCRERGCKPITQADRIDAVISVLPLVTT